MSNLTLVTSDIVNCWNLVESFFTTMRIIAFTEFCTAFILSTNDLTDSPLISNGLIWISVGKFVMLLSPRYLTVPGVIVPSVFGEDIFVLNV